MYTGKQLYISTFSSVIGIRQRFIELAFSPKQKASMLSLTSKHAIYCAVRDTILHRSNDNILSRIGQPYRDSTTPMYGLAGVFI